MSKIDEILFELVLNECNNTSDLKDREISAGESNRRAERFVVNPKAKLLAEMEKCLPNEAHPEFAKQWNSCLHVVRANIRKLFEEADDERNW
jgi:hypothetical protein